MYCLETSDICVLRTDVSILHGIPPRYCSGSSQTCNETLGLQLFKLPELNLCLGLSTSVLVLKN